MRVRQNTHCFYTPGLKLLSVKITHTTCGKAAVLPQPCFQSYKQRKGSSAFIQSSVEACASACASLLALLCTHLTTASNCWLQGCDSYCNLHLNPAHKQRSRCCVAHLIWKSVICMHLWPSNKSLSVWLLAVTDMGAGKIWSQAIPHAPNLSESSLFSCYWDVIYKYHHLLLLQLLWQTLTVYLHCLHWSRHRVLHVTVIVDAQLKPLTGVKKNCNPEPQSLQAATFFRYTIFKM